MTDASAGQKLKVFISYSRKDSGDFADELVSGLELVGFAPFLDRHDIAAGEDWEVRLGGLIQEADTVVHPSRTLPFFLSSKVWPQAIARNSRSADERFQLTIDSIGEMANSGEKFTDSMITAEPKVRSHRSAIEMAANEDRSNRTRDKHPRSAVTSGKKLFVNGILIWCPADLVRG